MGVLFEEIGGGVEAGLGFGGFTDFFDFGGGDHGGFVAEGVADVGEDGGEFFVGELLEGGHGNLAGVFFAFDFDGAQEAVEGKFDEAVFAAIDPFCFGKRREHGGGEAFAIGLVAGDAVAFATVNFRSLFEEDEGFAFERAGGFSEFFDGVSFDFLALEVGGGSFEDGLEPVVGGLAGDGFQDGKAFPWSEPGGGDSSFESDAGGFVSGGFLEEFGLVFDLVATVAEDVDGGGADAWVFCVEKVFEKGFIDIVETPSDPEDLEEMVLVTRRFWIKGSVPFLKDGEEFSRVAAAEFAARAVAGAVFGEGKIFEEGFE